MIRILKGSAHFDQMDHQLFELLATIMNAVAVILEVWCNPINLDRGKESPKSFQNIINKKTKRIWRTGSPVVQVPVHPLNIRYNKNDVHIRQPLGPSFGCFDVRNDFSLIYQT